MLTVETELPHDIPNYIWLDIKSFSPISPLKDTCFDSIGKIPGTELLHDPPPTNSDELCSREDFTSPPVKQSMGVRKAMWKLERVKTLMNQRVAISIEKHEKITSESLRNMLDTLLLFNFKQQGFITPHLKEEILQDYRYFIE